MRRKLTRVLALAMTLVMMASSTLHVEAQEFNHAIDAVETEATADTTIDSTDEVTVPESVEVEANLNEAEQVDEEPVVEEELQEEEELVVEEQVVEEESEEGLNADDSLDSGEVNSEEVDSETGESIEETVSIEEPDFVETEETESVEMTESEETLVEETGEEIETESAVDEELSLEETVMPEIVPADTEDNLLLSEIVEEDAVLSAVEAGQVLEVTSGTVTLTEDVIVPSVTVSGGTLDLAGFKLTVEGSFEQTGGTITINEGTLSIGGDFNQKNASVLVMKYADDTMEVSGDYQTQSTGKMEMTNGTLSIAGDLLIKDGTRSFQSSGNHTVIFTGNSSHLVSFKNDSVYLGIGKLQVDSGKITVDDYLSVGSMFSDVEITLVGQDELNLRQLGVNGKNVTIIGNVAKHKKTLDLAGGTLTVQGDFRQRGLQDNSIGCVVNISGGTLTVTGDYTQEAGYYGKLVMENANGKVNVQGSFTANTNVANSFSAGTLTIGKDLFVGGGHNYVFSGTGTHKIVFSGQNTHVLDIPDNTNHQIANLEVESGKITVNYYLPVATLHSDLIISLPDGVDLMMRKFGMNGHNVTIQGNVKKYTNTLNLDGGNLVVDGDFTQRGSSTDLVKISRGTMTVKGDYILEEGFYGSLVMETESDKLTVYGNFIAKSYKGNTLKAGTLTIGKDLFVSSRSGAFSGTGTHKLVFSGQNSHMLDIPDNLNHRIANLEVESGKITVNYYLPVGTIHSDLIISMPDDVDLIMREFGMNGHNVTIKGNVNKYTNTLNIAGGNLLVEGNFTQTGASNWHTPDLVKINRGTMTVKGDYILKEGFYGVLEMKYTNDLLVVEGDFIDYSAEESEDLTAGTMKVGGELIIGEGDEYNFHSRKEHEVVLTGNNQEKITWIYNPDAPNVNGNKSIGNLKIESGKLTANNFLNVAKLEKDLHITVPKGETLYLKDLGLNGHKLTIDGNVVQLGGTVKLDGGKLTVNGDYTQKGGTLKPNKGTMTVTGNFEQAAGCKSVLQMENSNDRLNVNGDFTTYSDSKNKLSAGLLDVKGDFTQGTGANNNFAPTGTHTVKLSGSAKQDVSFETYPSSFFNNLNLRNPIDSGYNFSPDSCYKNLVEWQFNDVSKAPGNWKFEAVDFISESGIMNGVGDGTLFDPDAPLTREMFATVLYRMAGEPSVTYTRKFPDVPGGKWYSNAVIWASEQGIVSGYPSGRFGTGDYITREQIAKMLNEYGKMQGYDVSQRADFKNFADAGSVSTWANDYMKWAVGSGMISGSTKNGKYYLNPKGNATRAESATMLRRFMDKY